MHNILQLIKKASAPILFVTLILLLPGMQAISQSISGNVVDKDGIGLPGTNILVKGTGNGTITDLDGNFTINASSTDTIRVSFLGFQSQEVAIAGRSVINIILSESTELLDEVIVVGYGTQTLKEVTSSIVSVKEEDFNKGNINDPVQLLAGKVAGLTVSKVGGSPTQGSVLRLRGLSTFGANAEPLVVIDGVVGGSLNNIDPNDISSIDVLKDASAAAIYGTRGSSGVIIVTTKSGNSSRKPTLELDVQSSFENISNQPKTASTEEFLAANGVDYGTATDWMDEVTRTAQSNVYNLAYSSNNGSTYYRGSINYRDIQGILKAESYSQLNARLNLTQKFLDDKLSITGIISFSNNDTDPANKGALRQALLWNPTAPIYVDNDPEKGFFETREQSIFNPVGLNALQEYESKTKQTLTNIKADYELLPGLNITGNYSYQINSNIYGKYINSKAIDQRGEELNGVARRSTFDGSDELFELITSYENSVNDFTYKLLGGYSYQYQVVESFFVENSNFITNTLGWNNLDIGQGLNDPNGPFTSLGSSKEENKLASFFGRINVSKAEIYNLSASLRREASSRFGDNNRWGNFWAVSGSVNISEMLDLNKIQNLKLRVGYGVTGNEPSQRYAFLETLGLQGLGYVNGQFVPAIAPTSNPNPDLKWEEKGELNIGLDFALLDYKITGSLDLYNRSTKDLLNTISVPSPPNLFNQTLVNLGELETKGFEATLNFRVFEQEDFSWNLGILYDQNETKLVKFNNLEAAEIFVENLGTPGFNNLLATRVREGEVIGNIMAPQYVRFNEDGRALVLDAEGNEVLATDALREDYIVAGNGLPDFSLNLTNSFQYKNFDFNFLWRGVFGHDIANLPASKLGHPVRAGQFRYIIGDFFEPNDNDDSAWHTEFIEDASFLRLDNITLGYSISNLSSIKNLRLYISGNNLVTITGYSGSDPEPRLVGNSGILAPGYDRLGNYFPTRSFTLGANITF